MKTVCHHSADVVVVLDQSTSVVREDYENWFTQMLGFACDITRAYDIGPNATQIGLLKFSDQIEIGFYLNDHADKTSVIGAILQQDILGGDTNIAKALKQTRDDMFSPSHGARAGRPKVVFVVTDGTPTVDAYQTVSEAKATRDAGIEIFLVGVTDQVTKSVMELIASEPLDSHLYFIETFDQLADIVQTLINMSCGTEPLSAASTTTTPTTTTTTTTTTTPTPSTTTTPGQLTTTVAVVVFVLLLLVAVLS